jgi:hypothetical protein
MGWTGNTLLNRAFKYFLNLAGSGGGWEMSDWGIASRADKAAAGIAGVRSLLRLDVRSEFDVFSQAGIKFIPPHQRCLWASFKGAGAKEEHIREYAALVRRGAS